MTNALSNLSLFEFQTVQETQSWQIVNDGVMGGISQSQIQWNEKNGSLLFSGNVSLENNGGFASIRTIPQDFKKGKFKTIHLRIKGDGKVYKFRMRNSNRFDGIAYSQNFETKKDEWTEIKLDVVDFAATFRGRIFEDYPKLDTNDLRQIGFMISNKQEGDFHLEVDWIRLIP